MAVNSDKALAAVEMRRLRSQITTAFSFGEAVPAELVMLMGTIALPKCSDRVQLEWAMDLIWSDSIEHNTRPLATM